MRLNFLLSIESEDILFNYLDEYMNANSTVPHVSGRDDDDVVFMAWLDEEAGDSTGLRVVKLIEQDGGACSTVSSTEAPESGETSTLKYPVVIISDAY